MKRNLLVIAILLIAALNCHAQRKIKKLVIEEKGFNVNLKFNTITNELNYNEVKVKITPVSSSNLNEKFLNESSFNGVHEYSHYENSRISYFLMKRKRKKEKTDYEFLMEGVDWLLENDKIDNDEYAQLSKKIGLNYDYETLPENYKSNNDNSCNPYYCFGRYLNTFEIEIINTTNSFQKFDKEILIETGDLLLYPLSSEIITENLKQNGILNQNKLLTLERYNLHNDIIIPPNSNFKKYFATVPMDYNTKELEISLQGINNKFKWIIDKNYDLVNESYSFYDLKTNWYYDEFSSDEGINFCLLKAPTNIYYEDNKFFIEERSINDIFEITALSLYSNKLYFIRATYKGTDYIDLEKNKRKSVGVKTVKLEEVKR